MTIYTIFPTIFVFWRKLSELTEKSYWLLSILCSGHSNFFSFDLRLLSFWDQKDIACPLPKSYAESKSDQNWLNESKNRAVTFSWFTAFQKSMFFEGSKKAGFWPKTQLFLIFLGTPIWVLLIFGKKWPPQKNGCPKIEYRAFTKYSH